MSLQEPRIDPQEVQKARYAVNVWVDAIEDFMHNRPWHLQSKHQVFPDLTLRQLPASMEYPNDARWTDRLDDMTAELYDMPWAPLILALESDMSKETNR